MLSSYYITDLISCNNKAISPSKKHRICDFIRTDDEKTFSRNTIFSIAVMEWFINGDLHTKSLIRLLYKYHQKYSDTNPTRYGKGIDSWLMNGAKWYRSDYECSCFAWCGCIAFAINDMNQLKTILKRAVKATNNTDIAQKTCEMLAIAIYINRKYKSKERTMQYMKKYYNYEPCTNYSEFIKNYNFSTNAKTNAIASLHCFFNTNSYEECVCSSLQMDSQFNIISSIAGMLAESLYNDIPISLTLYHLSYLPKEFVEIMYKFDTLHLEPNNKKIA